MKDAIDTVATIVMAVAALAIAGVALFGRGGPPQQEPTRQVSEDLWTEAWEAGRVVMASDRPDAPRILTFTDLQCPACRVFHGFLADLQERAPGAFEVRYLHHPLTYHPQAHSAALAAECAAATGPDVFAAFVDSVFAAQEYLAELDLASVAAAAGVSNQEAFDECRDARSGSESIELGLQLGGEMGLQGTPLVVIDGIAFNSTPVPPILDSIVGLAAGGAE